MRRSLNCFSIGIICLTSGVFTFQDVAAQNLLGNDQTPMRQTREQIAALPPSTGAGLSQTGFKPTTNNNRYQPRNEGQVHSSFYRQSSAQSAQRDVYPYPATVPPRTGQGSQSNYALSRNSASARLSAQMSPGSNATTGSLGNSFYGRAPVYNMNPNGAVLNPGGSYLKTSSRSLVEQQRASTLGPPRQSGLNTTASQTRANPATGASQPTTAYRQPTNPQTTLGLGNPQFRVAQNCNCAPGYTPVGTGYQAPAAFGAPSLNSNVGQGQVVPPLNIQVPGQPAVGSGCCQPNYQFQPGIGTPQYGAQGASWWTPFVSGSGVYTPLLKLRNMPVGTYLGQGIIGQPTAYVDGQPVRNLLRYVFP